MAKVLFSRGASAIYTALQQKDANTLYFLTDTKQIYLGGTLIANVSESNVEFVEVLPEHSAARDGVLYVVPGADGGIYIKGNSAMDQVSGGEAQSVKAGVLNLGNFQAGVVATEIGASPTDDTIPTAQAVKEYVDNVQTAITQQLTTLEGEIDTAFDDVQIVAGGTEHPNQFGLQFSRIGDKNPAIVYLDKEQYLLNADVAERPVGQPPESKQCLVLTVQIINPEGGEPGSKEVVIPIEDVVKVNASTVNTTSQITVTTTVGNYKPGDTIPASDLQAILTKMLSQDKWMGYNAPTMGGSISMQTSAEVGTNVTPSFNCTFNQGSYKTQSGATGSQPSPDCAVTGWTAAFTGQDDQTSASGNSFTGSFTQVQAEESAKTLTVTCAYGAAVNGPLTFLGASSYDGETSDDKKIPAGSLNKTSTLKGYRQGYFVGTTTDTAALDSATIRGLSTKKNAAYSATTINFAIPVGAARVVIAVPSTAKGVTAIQNTTINQAVLSLFSQSSVDVEGANGYAATAYKVWTYTPVEPYPESQNLQITFG